MKRRIVVALLLLAGGLAAQTGDTIWGRCPDYFYHDWYDQCDYYFEDPGFIFGDVPTYFSTEECGNPAGSLLAVRQSASHTMAVVGIAVMVSTLPQRIPSLWTERNSEYAILMSSDGNGMPGDTLAVARWDTSAPRTMLLPQNIRAERAGDTSNCLHSFKVYETRFPNPVTVDSLFFIAGTFNSNELTPPDTLGIRRYKYRTTSYTMVEAYQNICNTCMNDSPRTTYGTAGGWGSLQAVRQAGPFLLIPADGLELTVLAADSLMGRATGGGIYRSGEPAIVTATPAQFCRFASWSDGSTENPRVMYLYSDSTVTAFFTHDSSNYVRVLPNNPDWGIVSGAGIYPYGQSVTISATAAEGFLFTEWADGNRDNPRIVYPIGDTVFTALFDPVQADLGPEPPALNFYITPNPTQGSITVSCADGTHTLQLYDGSGRLVLDHGFSGYTVIIDMVGLPAGIYTAVLCTDNMPQARTLIKL